MFLDADLNDGSNWLTKEGAAAWNAGMEALMKPKVDQAAQKKVYEAMKKLQVMKEEEARRQEKAVAARKEEEQKLKDPEWRKLANEIEARSAALRAREVQITDTLPIATLSPDTLVEQQVEKPIWKNPWAWGIGGGLLLLFAFSRKR